MNKSRYSMSNLKVGLTVFIGLIVFIFLMFIVGSEENYFTPTYQLKIFVKDVNGLANGSMVTLGGLKIGYVDKLDFTNHNGENGIDIVIKVKSKYSKQITVNSKAEIKTIGLLGDKYVDISIGQFSEKALEENEYLQIKPSFELSDIAQDLKGAVNDFRITAKSIQRIIDTVNSGKGTIGKLIYSSEVYNETNSFVNNLNKLSQKLNDRNSTISKLLNDDDLYNELKLTLSDLNKISASLIKGEGSFGKLLKDDSLYNQLNGSVNKINNFLNKTEKNDNIIGGLVNDNALYDDITKTVKELSELIKEIKENPKKYINLSIF